MLSWFRVSGRVRTVSQSGYVWVVVGCLTALCGSACTDDLAGRVQAADEAPPRTVVAPRTPEARPGADARARVAARQPVASVGERGETAPSADADEEEEGQNENDEDVEVENPEGLDDTDDDTDGLDNDEPESLEGARELTDEEVVEAARDQGIETPRTDRFFDVPDAPIRARLATMAIAKVKRGTGGRSLGFKLTLEDGTKGYFKPEQSFSAANWNSEVAAYHLDRMLGFGRVPAVISREISWEDHLADAARGDSRRREVIVDKRGNVRGALVWWIPGGLRTWPDLPGFEQWIRVRGWPSTTVSSLQRPSVWAHQLNLRRKLGNAWLSPQERHRRRNFNPKLDRPDRAAELSDMLVFDYLTKNIDRWGGRNANVLVRGRGGPLVFLDNGAGFAPGLARPSLIESRLHVLQRFRRSTVKAVEAFDMETFRKRLEDEPLAPILHTREYRHLGERRDALLAWIHTMKRRYGERATPWE